MSQICPLESRNTTRVIGRSQFSYNAREMFTAPMLDENNCKLFMANQDLPQAIDKNYDEAAMQDNP